MLCGKCRDQRCILLKQILVFNVLTKFFSVHLVSPKCLCYVICGSHNLKRSYRLTLQVPTNFVGYINIFESSLPNIRNFSKFVTYLYNFPSKKITTLAILSLTCFTRQSVCTLLNYLSYKIVVGYETTYVRVLYSFLTYLISNIYYC